MTKLYAALAGLALFFACLLPSTAAAHGSIFTYKYIDGNNLVMVTHNVHEALTRLPITYNLRVYTMDGEPIPFQTVQTKVYRGTRLVHEQPVPVSDTNDTSFVYTYPKTGNYVLSFDFIDNGKRVAKGEFPIAVSASGDDFWAGAFTLQTAGAAVFGAAAATLYYERERLRRLAHRSKR